MWFLMEEAAHLNLNWVTEDRMQLSRGKDDQMSNLWNNLTPTGSKVKKEIKTSFIDCLSQSGQD